MHILIRWGFRMVRANGARTVRTILSVSAFFALLMGSWFITDGMARAVEASGSGLYWILEHIVFYSAIVLTVMMLFSVFSVTVDECRQDEWNLKSSGTTLRQFSVMLLYRALALDAAGALIGTLAGILLSYPMLGRVRFFAELRVFFTLPVTFTILGGALLAAPGTMLLAMLAALLPRRAKPRRARRWLLRKTLERRVFGVGGTIGRLSSNENRRYRTFFTLSFAVALTVSAILVDTMHLLSEIRLPDADAEVSLEYMTYADDTSVQDKVDALVQTCRGRGYVTDYSVCRSTFLNAGYNCYCLLDSDWLTDSARLALDSKRLFDLHKPSAPVVLDGKPMQYCPLYSIVFLDDATFDRYAAENGIDAGKDGTLLFCPDRLDKSVSQYLRPFDTPRDVKLHFLQSSAGGLLPDTPGQTADVAGSFDLAGYLLSADTYSVQKTVRLAGSVCKDPYPDGALSSSFLPEWIAPERLAVQFAYLPQQTDPSAPVSKTTVYLHTAAHADVCALFAEAFRDDTDCALVKLHFGVGGTGVNKTSAAAGRLFMEDYPEQQAALQRFTDVYVPRLQALLLLISTGMLFIGIFNIAHMNRLTRRREKAILESIGMGRRQKTGMLLYESTRYALRSMIYGLPGFGAYFAVLYRLIPINTYTAHLDMTPDALNHAMSVYISPAIAERSLLQTICDHRIWSVYAGGCALIFLVLVVTDTLVERHYRCEDLIQILTDDSQSAQ